ncbi:MAG: MFS transporter, partial [Ilumatobacteraceae bacterium]
MTDTALPDTSMDEFQEQQGRTLNVLRLAVVPGQAAVAGTIAVVSLLASDMLGNDRLAGLGSAAFTLGAAAVSIPLAAFMRRHGRRPGLIVALLGGGLGAAIAATGGQLRWFPLFILGMFFFGSGQAATLQARYVAADLAHDHDRARAIGAIVWIGTLGAVFGPVFTPFEKDVGQRLGLDEFIGPFLFAGVLFVLGAFVYWLLLKPDPLVLVGGTNRHAERTRPLRQVRHSYSVIRSSPGAMLGIVAMAASQASMVGVMTMTPPHMKDHAQGDLSAMVIAVHILGMFGLAPLVGRFVDRVGAVRAIQFGAVVLGSGT